MVTYEYAPVIQAGNGVIAAFGFSFKILAATDLVVSKTDSNGISSGQLVLGVDYTVVFDPIAENGTVTYTVPPVSGGFSLIARSSNNQQQSNLPREGSMPAKTVETMVDKTTMLIQELEAAVAAFTPASSGGQAVRGYIGTAAGGAVFAAANPGAVIVGVFLDSRTVQLFLGSSAIGQSGWAPLGGF